MIAEKIADSIASHRSEMLECARKLVSLPTENPPGCNYDRALEFLASHLRQLRMEPERIGDCLLCFVGKGKRTLYFSGHYDVVPAQNSSQFEPSIKGKNLFGRGSSDMKSGLAAMIYAAKAIRDCSVNLDGRIGLVFVPDEETAGPRGSRYLEHEGVLGSNGLGMLTPEPTGGVVWNANRGAITLKISVEGKTAHVGRQFEGVNAFEKMIQLVQSLAEFKKDVELRRTSFQIQPERARSSILMLGGQCGSGANFNVVPDTCWFTVDRRINPEENFEVEKERLLSLINKWHRSSEIAIEILQEGTSCGVSEHTLLGRALADSVKEVSGAEPRFEMCPGLLEIRFYAARGMPAYAYGPGLLTVSHGPNEFVPIQNIFDCATIYACTAAKMLSEP